LIYDDDKIIEMKQQGKTWDEIGEYFGVKGEKVRGYARKQDWYKQIKQSDPHDKANEKHKQTYQKDGSISSEIQRQLKEKKTFTKDELLEIHALDSNEFQIRTITSNEWSMTNAEGDKYWNFQSKIVAEPRVQEITPEFIANLFENVKPIEIELNLDEVPDSYLLIPLSDFHWGLNYANDYAYLKKEIQDLIIEGHSEILFVLNGDFFHVDNFLNTTERGTRVDDVDFERATEDAYSFIVDLLHCALEHSPYVKLSYLPGNHAPSVDYMFTYGLTKLFPQIEIDGAIDHFKHAWLGEHSIFLHHGDKRRTSTKLLEVIVSKFSSEWGESKSRYLITGHFHHEKSLSNAGVTHYQVSSPSKNTDYEKNNGYITSENGLMIFEFDDVKRRAIYYL
jgi:hypothetical protein